ncbi:unnamed protein product [Urochloa humidicola]
MRLFSPFSLSLARPQAPLSLLVLFAASSLPSRPGAKSRRRCGVRGGGRRALIGKRARGRPAPVPIGGRGRPTHLTRCHNPAGLSPTPLPPPEGLADRGGRRRIIQ